MFDTGVSAGGPARQVAEGVAGPGCDDDAVIAGLLGFGARCRVVENVARARVVESVCEIAEIRYSAADCTGGHAGGHAGGDPLEIAREVVGEVAAALALSQQVARPLLEVGTALERMPLTAVRFVCGALDFSRARVLTSILDKASDATIAALEHDAVAAAERRGPRALRAGLWRAWMAHDRDEAAAARAAAAAAERGVHTRPRDGGLTDLIATLTDVEGAEAETLIAEIAQTVCPRDPRTGRALRADALMALLHGEHALECRCDRGEHCPQAGVADRPDRRRGHLLQILVDIRTLLGLTDNPATLPDGTPLDPEVVRVLATDARWQGLLTELLTAYKTHNGNDADDREGSHDGGGGGGGGDAGGVPGSGVPVPALLARTRIGSAASLPAPGRILSELDLSGAGAVSRYSISECDRARVTAVLLAALAADPALARGAYPDGHGGLVCPPAGALTYRPSAHLAARVRMTYSTCTHPGCDVPSTACELDHIMPFDHTDPEKGGWTIAANLHPACSNHHALKTQRAWTVTALAGHVIVWTSRAGARAVTLPELGCPQPPRTHNHRGRRKTKTDHAAPDLAAPTWWEQHQPSGASPPTAADVHAADTDGARDRMRALRRRFREHTRIQRLRKDTEPPPF